LIIIYYFYCKNLGKEEAIFINRTINDNNKKMKSDFFHNIWEDKRSLLYRTLLSLLAGFSIPFTLLYGLFDIYANNREEFVFPIKPISVYILWFGIGLFIAISGFILIMKGKVFDVIFAFNFGLSLMIYLQGNFLNGTLSLFGDEVGSKQNGSFLSILNLLIWIAVLAACVFIASSKKRNDIFAKTSVVILLALIVMQLSSFVVININLNNYNKKAFPDETESTDIEAETATSTSSASSSSSTSSTSGDTDTSTPPDSDTPVIIDPGEAKNYVLTEKNLFEISKDKNVIVFVLDRFDANYYDELANYDKNIFSGFDGFTYYSDNISIYSRTYPALTQMITGKTNPFTKSAPEYFYDAYHNSDFLNDLKDNNFKINFYTGEYYSYRDISELVGVADNVISYDDYDIKSPASLAVKMLTLSAYRYSPTILKSAYTISSTSFNGSIEYNSEYPAYTLNDAKLYENFCKSGLSVASGKNTFTLIHMNGLHPPCNITPDGKYTDSDSASTLDASRGCFKFISEYIKSMKKLGKYKDATIIITGDHATPYDDYNYISDPRLTAMFIKMSGDEGTPFKVSDVPVSHDYLQATIIKSAGIRTKKDYGPAYDEVTKDMNLERHYLFERNSIPEGDDSIVEYHINGSGKVFENWKIYKEYKIGQLYK